MQNRPHIAIVGATGAVGIEMLRVLEDRDFPVRQITLLASERSAGKQLDFQGTAQTVKPLTHDAFEGVDIALFSAGSSISREYAASAVKAGAVVIDNSSAFRMEPDVPLVIPEINPDAAQAHRGIIANPNCTTAVTLMAVAPLHRTFGVRTMIAASYQAVSGSGAKGLEELEQQARDWAAGNPLQPSEYPCPILFNLIPEVDSPTENGYTKEEMKLANESRKILGHPELRASITCVRVPVLRAHSVACTVQCEKPVSLTEAYAAWEAAPGLTVIDDLASHQYPTPLVVAGHEDCAVGRARLDLALDNALTFWVSGDQLLKGAALNAVQIAELLL